MPSALERGRESFARRSWETAFRQLSIADAESSLAVDDLERMATAAYLIADIAESVTAWTRAYRECLHAGNRDRAARCAFWLSFVLINTGAPALGSGWVHRAWRMLDTGPAESVDRGYLSYCRSLQRALEGDVAVAAAGFADVAATGQRFDDPQLVALAQAGQGRCLIWQGRVAEGIALLDEAMVAVTVGEVSATAVGDLYCTAIEGCQDVLDVGRATEWTAALTIWCTAQPELVLFHGQCLIHRAELMLLNGAWPAAVEEAQRACRRLAEPSKQPALGSAHYVRAELHRLRGEFTQAEHTYRLASRFGREPQPGLAQLRLAQGRVAEARQTMDRVIGVTEDPVRRSRLLAPYVEIVLAAGDLGAARAAADQLSAIAATPGLPFLSTLSDHANGSVLLAEGHCQAAVATLHRALAGWRGLSARYEAARTRVLIGRACLALGDESSADLEFEAALTVFRDLGATPDVAATAALAGAAHPAPTGGLTAREVQVLGLVATGRTNREIAADLVISEKTVATHVSNIFTKLRVSSRSAATAYAYEHHLV